MRRKTDVVSLTSAVICLLCVAVIGFVLAPAVLDTSRLANRLAAEGRERRHQSCTLFERDHLQDVQRLERTYSYLDRLPREEWGKAITVAIVRQLPEIEREARTDSAPPFCDRPGAAAERLYERTDGKEGAPPVGLPEPDPDIPERRDYRRLLHPAE